MVYIEICALFGFIIMLPRFNGDYIASFYEYIPIRTVQFLGKNNKIMLII